MFTECFITNQVRPLSQQDFVSPLKKMLCYYSDLHSLTMHECKKGLPTCFLSSSSPLPTQSEQEPSTSQDATDFFYQDVSDCDFDGLLRKVAAVAATEVVANPG